MLKIIALMYIASWISFIAGYIFLKSGSSSARKLEKFTWNSRIKKFQERPFNKIIDAFEKKNFLLALVCVIGINFNMVIFQALTGFILLSPIVVIFQAFLMGILIAQADRKTTVFSLFVLIFELGAFSTSGAIGLHIGIEWIFTNVSFVDSFKDMIAKGYYLIPVICLLLNGLFEASGVFFGIKGVPGAKAVKEQLYK